MTTSVQDVLEQLQAAVAKLDQAAMAAHRARIDAEEAYARFAEAGRGSDHPQIRAARTNAREAADKAGKAARLYAEAAAAYVAYINHIAPGTAPRRADPGAVPSGAWVVEEAATRGSRGEAFLRKHLKNTGDIQDAVKQAEHLVTTGAKEIFKAFKPGPSGTTTTTTVSPTPAPPERPHVEHPVTAVVLAAGAVATAGKALWRQAKQRRERKPNDGTDQT